VIKDSLASLACARKAQRPLVGEVHSAEQPSGELTAQNVRQVVEFRGVDQAQRLSHGGILQRFALD
jgi:hypothetical protein